MALTVKSGAIYMCNGYNCFRVPLYRESILLRWTAISVFSPNLDRRIFYPSIPTLLGSSPQHLLPPSPPEPARRGVLLENLVLPVGSFLLS
jgi:hypothetical protein